jgi:hypothetical protein
MLSGSGSAGGSCPTNWEAAPSAKAACSSACNALQQAAAEECVTTSSDKAPHRRHVIPGNGELVYCCLVVLLIQIEQQMAVV